MQEKQADMPSTVPAVRAANHSHTAYTLIANILVHDPRADVYCYGQRAEKASGDMQPASGP